MEVDTPEPEPTSPVTSDDDIVVPTPAPLVKPPPPVLVKPPPPVLDKPPPAVLLTGGTPKPPPAVLLTEGTPKPPPVGVAHVAAPVPSKARPSVALPDPWMQIPPLPPLRPLLQMEAPIITGTAAPIFASPWVDQQQHAWNSVCSLCQKLDGDAHRCSKGHAAKEDEKRQLDLLLGKVERRTLTPVHSKPLYLERGLTCLGAFKEADGAWAE